MSLPNPGHNTTGVLMTSIRRIAALRFSLYISAFIWILLAADTSMCFDNNPPAKDKSSISENRLKSLAETATALARIRLADNPKDDNGLLLVKFARFFYPNYRDLLLLRGQLKFNVKIEKPKVEIKESEFISNLEKSIESMEITNTGKSRKMLAIFYGMIRVLQPTNEEALVNLTMLEYIGTEINLENLLAPNESEYQMQQIL